MQRQARKYLLSITRVETSADLRNAKVYISGWGSDGEQMKTIRELRKRLPFISYTAAKQVAWHTFPSLKFVVDQSLQANSQVNIDLANSLSL